MRFYQQLAAVVCKRRADILFDEFLGRAAALNQRNLALETLRDLLPDQIESAERTNATQSKRFREALEDALVTYADRAITTADVVSRLLELATWVREAKGRGRNSA